MKSQARIPELDGLRGLAIIMVLVCHFAEWGDYQGVNILIRILLAISFLGFTGVDLFFVLSGFLICGILLDNRDSLNYYKVFYIRRSLRVFPLYYALLTFFSLIVLASAHDVLDTPEWLFGFQFPAWAYFAYTQNIFMSISNSWGISTLAPTWSLAVEEQFYLTFPFIARFLPKKYLVPLLLVGVASAILFRMLISTFYPENVYAIALLAPARADSLLIGALAAIAIRSEMARNYLINHRSRLYLGIASVGVLTIAGGALYYYTGVGQILFGFVFTLIALVCVMMIFLSLTLDETSRFRRFLRNAILLEFGALSYFIYLTHIGVLGFFHWQFGIIGKTPFGFIWVAEVVLSLITCLVFAKISQKFFEQPLIRLGHSFRYKTADLQAEQPQATVRLRDTAA